MQTIDLKLPYTEVTLLLDALRHYTDYIENLDENSVDEDTYADLLNDNENIKALEKSISEVFAKQVEPY
ncbi:hypothetical protein MNBD_GAMMA09-3688 [hydrothermal vent metagenome]|uniref:Uncharacterized protein n=1 Tax=hydrothermal vent metagenome TaxID=652676 RepID=A0A3B0Y4B8_9ZZZZ